jgi:hypothetical protein
MAYINESCGCDGGGGANSNEHQHMINSSPLLSGSQEMLFSPETDAFSFLGNSNNNFSNNDDSKNYSLDDLINMSKETEKISNDENKFSNNNIHKMNYQDMGQPSTNNMPMNSMPMNSMPATNNNMPSVNNNMAMNNNMQMNNNMPSTNNMPMNLPDSGIMRQMPQNVNPELQKLMNNLSNRANMEAQVAKPASDSGETTTRFILKNFNIVLIVIIALAWNDVAKFYINRSIKFGSGTHKYYLYYALLATVVLYGTSKYIYLLN